MRRTGSSPQRATPGRSWRALRVHLDAARLAPRAYLTALWSRLRGKRLRARGQFAPLLAASPQAYRLWLDRAAAEPPAADGAAHGSAQFPSIIALIDATAGGGGLDETVRSVAAEGIAAIPLETLDHASFAAVARKIDRDSGGWIMPLAAGDVLAPGAAQAYRDAIAGQAGTTGAMLVYADDDLRDATGARADPHFKPDWNAELFRYFDYLTGSCILRVDPSALAACDGPDWALRLVTAATRAGPPRHVRRILHHRRTRPQPHVPAVPTAATTAAGENLPCVSVIIPTRNRLDLLRPCIEGLERTDYAALEVIVVDNGSDDPATLAYLAGLAAPRYRVMRHDGAFNFSAINNRAAEIARGTVLCLLNNDIEMRDPAWLGIMVRQALRDDVGAVGAQLLYPDGRVQHAGVVLGIGGAAAHAHRLLDPAAQGYFRRHATPHFVSAVTAACLVVTRDRFRAVGGLDERRFAVAFNDVDLCMKLNRRGWQTLYEPRAVLIHHESVSRGLDRDPVGAARLAAEVRALQAAWHTDDTIDPFHHPALSPFSERFVLRL